ncbi:hypothetical protein [Jiella pelagia]|uniref:DUF4956 domain-containing protein n=1 Tax=Jiella pelagia TaxID=2986949 RepID=A0ABY7BTX4_9HYPH|nr:hypothetical protein [Jiella pelagia]WAP66978.1 hypothetical protein OH818_15135 [Jiella pelagia]|tara:strand:+ start:1090 stop:1641 length:552 start_codon:yes stop_codon:yes gene_type:complete
MTELLIGQSQNILFYCLIISTLIIFLIVATDFLSIRFVYLRGLIGISIPLLSVCLLGIVAGYSGGNSRVSAVGDIIPAALSILAGLSLYLFGVETKNNLSISFLVIGFVSSIYVGFTLGAMNREKRQNFEMIFSSCNTLYYDKDAASKPEFSKFFKDREVLCEPVRAHVINTIRRAVPPKTSE